MISSKSKRRNINGIEYPREVPAPDGFPPGWVGIEQAYGEGTKYWGQTYTRFSSLDKKYRLVLNPRGVIERHCEDNGLDFDTEFAKYEKAKVERQEREKEIKTREAEARGVAKGQAREDMVALSRKHLDELKGEIVFAFPGWRCRWDLLPESQQTPKTFTDPDGNEFKLLKDLECKFGIQITQNSGVVPAHLKAMVDAGKTNTEAHALFSTGSTKARESGGSVVLSADSAEAKIQTAEERLQWKLEREAQRTVGVKKRKMPKLYHAVKPSDYNSWDAVLSFPSNSADTTPDLRDAVAWLLSHGFSKKNSVLHVATTGQAEQRYAKALAGLYCLKGKDEDSGRPCYQGVAASSRVTGAVAGLDRYIYWSAHHERWEMGTMKPNKACIAYASDECATPDEAKAWRLLRDDFGSDTAANSSASATPSSAVLDSEASAPSKHNADTSSTSKPEHPSEPEEVKVSKRSKQKTPEEAKVSKKAKHEAKPTAPQVNSLTSAASISSSSAAASKEASAAPDSGGDWHTEKIWGYEERTSRRGSDLAEKPKHWPEHVEIFPGPWSSWLPSDWGQGKMKNLVGQDRTKYISPGGAICHQKDEVERKLDRKLQGDKVLDWHDWLPKDWFRSEMPKTTGGLAPIYICPDKTRFLRSRNEVLKCIADGAVGQRGPVLKVRPTS